jgi:hypothetical protein
LPWKSGLFLKELIDHGVHITDNWRNDDALIELREHIVDADDPLPGFRVKLAKYQKGEASDEELLAKNIHIVFGNDYRQQLNVAILKSRGYVWQRQERKLAAGEEVHFRSRANKNKAYNWRVSGGVRLRALATKKTEGYAKGEVYELIDDVDNIKRPAEVKPKPEAPVKRRGRPKKVQATAPEKPAKILPDDVSENCFATAQIRRIYPPKRESGADEDILSIKVSNLIDFGLGWAITAFSSIGTTIREPGAWHQAACMLRDGAQRGLAYTALTRFCEIDNVSVVMAKMRGLPGLSPEQQELRGQVDDEDGGFENFEGSVHVPPSPQIMP